MEAEEYAKRSMALKSRDSVLECGLADRFVGLRKVNGSRTTDDSTQTTHNKALCDSALQDAAA